MIKLLGDESVGADGKLILRGGGGDWRHTVSIMPKGGGLIG